MIRVLALSLILTVAGPQPEALVDRMLARMQQDRDYDACVARGGQDDWTCELILETWPANRPHERMTG